MLDACFKDVNTFKHLVHVLKDIVVDCILCCHHDKMTMQAMDASHVILCSFTLSKNAFEYYMCENQIELGINMPTLESILKCSKKDDTLTLKASEQCDRLDLLFENKVLRHNAIYSIQLMHIDVDELVIPDTSYPTNIKMSASYFQDVCKDLLVVGDTCDVLSCSNRLEFHVHGNTTQVKMCMHNTEEPSSQTLEISAFDTVTQKFSLKKLSMFSKASCLSSLVHIGIGDMLPMQVKYMIAENCGILSFYIAPRVEV
jgi:proliferating cell nuclear antigen